eukprot:3958570-Prorocentrum_lima.AAC.1
MEGGWAREGTAEGGRTWCRRRRAAKRGSGWLMCVDMLWEGRGGCQVFRFRVGNIQGREYAGSG